MPFHTNDCVAAIFLKLMWFADPALSCCTMLAASCLYYRTLRTIVIILLTWLVICLTSHNICIVTDLISSPCGLGYSSFPLVHLLPHLFPFLLFAFFHWLYLFSSFVHPFSFYQNSPTPFPGRRS